MKSIILLNTLLLVACSVFGQAPNTWMQKADFGGTGRWGAVGFSIGSKGYIGTGAATDGIKKDFWEYDPEANSWTQKADFGGAARYGAVGFIIGNKGYLGTGFDGNIMKDFWEYDPDDNLWAQKADFEGPERFYAVGFSVGSKGYLGSGAGAFNLYKDFWEFDPSANTWTQKADFMGTARYQAIGFSIGNKGYLGTGYSGNDYTKDFWEYDPDANTWSEKVDFGGVVRGGAVGFTIGNKGYCGTGYSLNGEKKDFWEYDPLNDTWTQKAYFGGTGRMQAVCFSIGIKGYIGTGFATDGIKNDFWEYTPDEVVSTCNIPTNLSTDNITSSASTLKWDAVNGAINYQLLYKAAGTSQWSFLHSSANEITLDGLSPNTEYTWRVKSVCSISPMVISKGSALKFTTSPLRSASETNNSSVNVFPNPFSNSTTLSISLSEDVLAVIELVDLEGREIQTIINENLGAGNHEVKLNRGQLNSGVYLLQVKVNDQLEVRKLVVE